MAKLPPVYEYTESTALLQSLHPFLPYSLPLYRRLQFGRRSSHAHILSTLPPEEPRPAAAATENAEALCLGVAFVDRSCRPETEAWFFLSHDAPGHISQRPADCTCTTHLFALLGHIGGLAFPALSAEAEADALAAVNAAVPDKAAAHHVHTSAPAAAYLTYMNEQAFLKAGTLHSRNVSELRARDCLRTDMPGVDFPYVKYIFSRDCSTVTDVSGTANVGSLPDSLRWGALREEDFALVRSRTAIPRTNRTLRSLPSAAIFPVEPATAPIAWAFLGVDGSLVSLHVEPGYRGCGLAKTVARKLLRQGNMAFGDAPVVDFHADVALENKESHSVCRSLGGKQHWEVYWVRIDLTRIREKTEKGEY
ncbi:uncharacterized protein K452DRAFT_262587 [Aplosporella prunicola CBS 121167]|uniref:GCN5-related N-acetyltransferase Rv2170-like domain-containing protein n=1 Tax=Aplosporella prunicola CBS 121167 TaxID=1176127 RepID=A0A6A6BVC2_9PEZI|nr:uncharacterized protein K452DRAFT_262587 [Aplosporella prunicola CBS 121167]KAF2146631.1 hypothetical protein K452DRAFT_262587 [Aplosporella prunicola CBS 121167]